jgi:hypothetical protein
MNDEVWISLSVAAMILVISLFSHGHVMSMLSR